MEFHKFFEAITDRSKKLSHRATYFIFIVLTIVVIDNTLSFSYYYNSEKKISQVSELSKIIEKNNLEQKELNELVVIRNNLIHHQTIKDKLFDYLTELNFEATDSVKFEKTTRNETFHFLSTNWWIILILILSFKNAVFDLISKKETLITTLVGMTFIVLTALIVMFGFSKVLSFIPLIAGQPLFNYTVNVVVGICIVAFLLKFYRAED